DAPTRAFDFHGAQEHSVSLSKTRHCYLSTLVRSTTNSRQRGHIVSLGFTWIRQAIIVFRPFSEHSGVKGPKNLRTWASAVQRRSRRSRICASCFFGATTEKTPQVLAQAGLGNLRT